MTKEVNKIVKKTRSRRKLRDPSMKHTITVYCSQEELDQFKDAVRVEGSDTSTEVRRMMKGYAMRREVFGDE